MTPVQVRNNRLTAVATRTLAGAARLRVTTAYTIMLVGVSFTLTALGPHARHVAVSRMSTNLHNLSHGRMSTLVGSAFVDGGNVWVWLPGLVCLLALGELIWRGRGLIVAFAVGHIGATLIVAAGLAAALAAGWLPMSIARASDVGVSYGAVCVLGRTGVNFGAGFTGGFAYVLDLERNFVDRYNHELIDISRIHPEAMQSHVQHLEGLLERHVAESASVWADEILSDLRTFLPKFWVVKPKAASIDSLIENLRRAA